MRAKIAGMLTDGTVLLSERFSQRTDKGKSINGAISYGIGQPNSGNVRDNTNWGRIKC